jgi:hypothetical protein
MPSEETTIPPRSTPSEPQLVRKDGDREPPQDPNVGSGVTPVVIGNPRGGDGETS